jgi:hypothetical protein
MDLPSGKSAFGFEFREYVHNHLASGLRSFKYFYRLILVQRVVFNEDGPAVEIQVEFCLGGAEFTPDEQVVFHVVSLKIIGAIGGPLLWCHVDQGSAVLQASLNERGIHQGSRNLTRKLATRPAPAPTHCEGAAQVPWFSAPRRHAKIHRPLLPQVREVLPVRGRAFWVEKWPHVFSGRRRGGTGGQ